MENEIEASVTGTLVKDRILIADDSMQEQLKSKGYGEEFGSEFCLAHFEALYLLYAGRLTLIRRGKSVSFEQMLNAAARSDQDILVKFLIYRDLRSRGYTVKDGFGFGADFRVYERGHFGEKGAKYLVFGLSEGRQEKAGSLQKKIEEITRMGKEPIIAVIERRGEVIYYKISKTAFQKNKNLE